jgi:hypothetical protein
VHIYTHVYKTRALVHYCTNYKQYGIRVGISDVMGWPTSLMLWRKIKKTITKLFAHFTFKSPPISSDVEYLKGTKSGRWDEMLRRGE